MNGSRLALAALLLVLLAVPGLAEETVICPECGAENPAESNYCSECGAELPVITEGSAAGDAKEYSWSTALLGNLLPGLGYFLIDEPWWGVAELGLMGVGTGLVIIGANETSGFLGGLEEMVYGFTIMGAAWLGGLIHAPLLAEDKNERAGYTLSLRSGLMLTAEGSPLPALTLDLRF